MLVKQQGRHHITGQYTHSHDPINSTASIAMRFWISLGDRNMTHFQMFEKFTKKVGTKLHPYRFFELQIYCPAPPHLIHCWAVFLHFSLIQNYSEVGEIELQGISKTKAPLRTLWACVGHDHGRVRYTMLQNLSITLLSVTLKTVALCRKLCSKSSTMLGWSWFYLMPFSIPAVKKIPPY